MNSISSRTVIYEKYVGEKGESISHKNVARLNINNLISPPRLLNNASSAENNKTLEKESEKKQSQDSISKIDSVKEISKLFEKGSKDTVPNHSAGKIYEIHKTLGKDSNALNSESKIQSFKSMRNEVTTEKPLWRARGKNENCEPKNIPNPLANSLNSVNELKSSQTKSIQPTLLQKTDKNKAVAKQTISDKIIERRISNKFGLISIKDSFQKSNDENSFDKEETKVISTEKGKIENARKSSIKRKETGNKEDKLEDGDKSTCVKSMISEYQKGILQQSLNECVKDDNINLSGKDYGELSPKRRHSEENAEMKKVDYDSVTKTKNKWHIPEEELNIIILEKISDNNAIILNTKKRLSKNSILFDSQLSFSNTVSQVTGNHEINKNIEQEINKYNPDFKSKMFENNSNSNIDLEIGESFIKKDDSHSSSTISNIISKSTENSHISDNYGKPNFSIASSKSYMQPEVTSSLSERIKSIYEKETLKECHQVNKKISRSIKDTIKKTTKLKYNTSDATGKLKNSVNNTQELKEEIPALIKVESKEQHERVNEEQLNRNTVIRNAESKVSAIKDSSKDDFKKELDKNLKLNLTKLNKKPNKINVNASESDSTVIINVSMNHSEKNNSDMCNNNEEGVATEKPKHIPKPLPRTMYKKTTDRTNIKENKDLSVNENNLPPASNSKREIESANEGKIYSYIIGRKSKEEEINDWSRVDEVIFKSKEERITEKEAEDRCSLVSDTDLGVNETDKDKLDLENNSTNVNGTHDNSEKLPEKEKSETGNQDIMSSDSTGRKEKELITTSDYSDGSKLSEKEEKIRHGPMRIRKIQRPDLPEDFRQNSSVTKEPAPDYQ